MLTQGEYDQHLVVSEMHFLQTLQSCQLTRAHFSHETMHPNSQNYSYRRNTSEMLKVLQTERKAAFSITFHQETLDSLVWITH